MYDPTRRNVSRSKLFEMDFSQYSSILTAAATGAALYFSPYNSSILMAAVHGFVVSYAVKSATSGDANHLKCAAVTAVGAAAGFYAGPMLTMDPQMLSAIGGAGAYILLDQASLY